MRIELRILSGARAGQSEAFDQRTILVGRQLAADLRFDAHADLDVSAEHAEIVERSGRWFVVDRNSTNGTFVNGALVRGESRLKDGDVIAFGKNGPTVEVRAKGDPTGKIPVMTRASAAAVSGEVTRLSTQERVAIAVRSQTRGLKTMLIGSMVGLGGLAIVAYWMGNREGSRQVAEVQHALAQAESTSATLRDRVRRQDTSFSNALARHVDSLRSRVQATTAHGNEAEIAALTVELEKSRLMQQGMATVDYTSIHDRNDPAIAFLVSDIGGTLYGGTAFSISKTGLLVTNRHNVRSDAGVATTKLTVQFANTTIRLAAHVVKASNDPDEDLALIQIDDKGTYPTVAGVSATGESKVGAMVVTIGFPLSLELAMEGGTVSTTLSAGPTSKHLAGLLQVDSWGAHGLSGAPVFDTSGNVVGVVWGGPKENARVVYAVPSDRVVAFIGDAAQGIVR